MPTPTNPQATLQNPSPKAPRRPASATTTARSRWTRRRPPTCCACCPAASRRSCGASPTPRARWRRASLPADPRGRPATPPSGRRCRRARARGTLAAAAVKQRCFAAAALAPSPSSPPRPLKLPVRILSTESSPQPFKPPPRRSCWRGCGGATARGRRPKATPTSAHSSGGCAPARASPTSGCCPRSASSSWRASRRRARARAAALARFLVSSFFGPRAPRPAPIPLNHRSHHQLDALQHRHRPGRVPRRLLSARASACTRRRAALYASRPLPTSSLTLARTSQQPITSRRRAGARGGGARLPRPPRRRGRRVLLLRRRRRRRRSRRLRRRSVLRRRPPRQGAAAGRSAQAALPDGGDEGGDADVPRGVGGQRPVRRARESFF